MDSYNENTSHDDNSSEENIIRKIDLDRLAEKILALLKRDVLIEHERQGNYRHWLRKAGL